MSELKIAGNPLPGMPWEERPEGCKNVMWRCSANPIIPRSSVIFLRLVNGCTVMTRVSALSTTVTM